MAQLEGQVPGRRIGGNFIVFDALSSADKREVGGRIVRLNLPLNGDQPLIGPQEIVFAERLDRNCIQLLQRAGGLIDLEDGDGARLLIGGEEPAAGRVDREVSRRFPPRGFDFDDLQRSVIAGAEHRNAVVPPIGTVHEPAGWVDLDLRRRARALELCGQRRDRPQRRERARIGVPLEAGDCRIACESAHGWQLPGQRLHGQGIQRPCARPVGIAVIGRCREQLRAALPRDE